MGETGKKGEKGFSKDLDAVRCSMQTTHDAGVNHTYEWRMDQLRRMRRMVVNEKDEIARALYQDLGKSYTESASVEYAMLMADIDVAIANLKGWMRPELVASPVATIPARSIIRKVPKAGPACLVIAPFNYPFLLALQPAVGALAAGNPVIIKPSELCLATATLMQKICDDYFETSVLKVMQGGIPETNELLSKSWGMVFFTGSERVGKIVAEATAKTLTPTVMELGGKCPCYVDVNHAPLSYVADRIIWAKTYNTGQTCASVDTLIVHKDVIGHLVPELLACMEKQFPSPRKTSELGRLVSIGHAQRQFAMIKEVEKVDSSKIICGGTKKCDVANRFIDPTIILNPPAECRLMQEEIFGPILPIVVVESESQAVEHIQNMYGIPLCLYVFTSKTRVFENLRKACPSGSLMRNDALMHLSSTEIPFGGLGTSGYGNYHGKYSFDAFSHKQPTMTRFIGPGMDLCNLRCHPYYDNMPHQKEQNVIPGEQKGLSPDWSYSFSLKGWVVQLAVGSLGVLPVARQGKVIFGVILLAIFVASLSNHSAATWVAEILEDIASWLRG